MATPNSVFETFLTDIEPSPTTKSDASVAHGALRGHLKTHETFQEVHIKTYLSGSYKRDTSIRPKTVDGVVQRPDIDIIVLVNHALSDQPADVLNELYKALQDGEYDVRKQDRSVCVTTNKAVMDVVPIIAPFGEEGTLYIADRKLEKWLETNPPRHTTWTTEMNEKAGKRFKPLAKLLKWWRRENPTASKRPKGFVLECLAAECISFSETHYGELFVGTLEKIVLNYAAYITLKSVPFVADPGVPGNSVLTGISFEAFEGFYNKVKAHAEKGRQALNEEDVEKATALWRQIFGDRFPEVTSTKKSASLLGAAVQAPSAIFPDRPITPSRRQGFA